MEVTLAETDGPVDCDDPPPPPRQPATASMSPRKKGIRAFPDDMGAVF
jgi:hypothetical protein